MSEEKSEVIEFRLHPRIKAIMDGDAKGQYFLRDIYEKAIDSHTKSSTNVIENQKYLVTDALRNYLKHFLVVDSAEKYTDQQNAMLAQVHRDKLIELMQTCPYYRVPGLGAYSTTEELVDDAFAVLDKCGKYLIREKKSLPLTLPEVDQQSVATSYGTFKSFSSKLFPAAPKAGESKQEASKGEIIASLRKIRNMYLEERPKYKHVNADGYYIRIGAAKVDKDSAKKTVDSAKTDVQVEILHCAFEYLNYIIEENIDGVTAKKSELDKSLDLYEAILPGVRKLLPSSTINAVKEAMKLGEPLLTANPPQQQQVVSLHS